MNEKILIKQNKSLKTIFKTAHSAASNEKNNRPCAHSMRSKQLAAIFRTVNRQNAKDSFPFFVIYRRFLNRESFLQKSTHSSSCILMSFDKCVKFAHENQYHR